MRVQREKGSIQAAARCGSQQVLAGRGGTALQAKTANDKWAAVEVAQSQPTATTTTLPSCTRHRNAPFWIDAEVVHDLLAAFPVPQRCGREAGRRQDLVTGEELAVRLTETVAGAAHSDIFHQPEVPVSAGCSRGEAGDSGAIPGNVSSDLGRIGTRKQNCRAFPLHMGDRVALPGRRKEGGQGEGSHCDVRGRATRRNRT